MEYEGADTLLSRESEEFTRIHEVTRLMEVTGSFGRLEERMPRLS